MAIEVQCDACQQQYRLPEKMAGKRVRCRDCGAAIDVPTIAVRDDENQEITDLSDFESGIAQSNESEWTSDVNPFDLPTSFKEMRGRLVPRPITPFRYPFNDIVDSMLPWLLVLVFLVPAVWRAISNILSMPRRWVGAVELGLVAVMYVALAIPLVIRALRSAARSFKFRLPDQIYWHVFAAMAVPIGLGSFFYAQLEWNGFFFGYGLGLVLALVFLAVEFSLLPIEILLSAGFVASFYVAATVATWYVSTSVEPLGDLVVSMVHPSKKTPGKPTVVVKKTPSSAPAAQPSNSTPVAPAPNVVPGSTDYTLLSNPARPVPTPDVTRSLPPQENIKSSSPAVADINILTEPRGFDQALLSRGGSPGLAVIRHGPSDDQIESWAGDPLTMQGSASFKRTGVNDRCILSPRGDAFVRITNWPQSAAIVWSFASQSIVRTVELNERSGVPELVGYLNNDQLAIRYDRGGGAEALEIWDLRSQGTPRPLFLQPYIPNTMTFSPDGRSVAIAVRADPNAPKDALHGPQVMLINLATGIPRRLAITKLDPKLPITSAGIAFSSDGSRVALLCENNDNLLIEGWQTTTLSPKPIYEHVYPAGILPLNQLASFPGRTLSWLDKQTVLLYGNVILDLPTGKMLAAMALPQIRDQQVIDEQNILLQYQTSQGTNALMHVKLDRDVLEQSRGK